MKQADTPGPPQLFLPRYEVICPLGEGGVATVYKVRDTKEGSIKALKALKHGGSRTSANVRRFEEEYRILRSLHHPSLPEAFDYGVTKDFTRYIVMDFVKGTALDDYHRSRTDELWLLLYELSEALAFIHDHGFLHLDLKPRNVLVRSTRAFGGAETPLVTLLDFGVSHRRSTGEKVATVGSPGYMAPEIIRGDAEVTRAVDYYSLGVTVYQLIENRLPFDGPVKDVLRAHLNDAPVFRQQQDRYADLYPRIEQLMSKDPRERLEAFDDFRALAALKVHGDLQSLEQAYGMGYLDSFGIVGKTDVWNRLRGWGVEIASRIDELEGRHNPYRNVGTALETTALEETADLLTTTVDLDASAAPQDGGDSAQTPPMPDVTRTSLISGPGGSGKSFVVDALVAELQLASVDVVLLGERSEYEALVVATEPEHTTGSEVDPQSIIVDRFVRGWERLEAMGRDNGVVLVLDGFERASKEEKEFFEYAARRVELTLDEGDDPGIFFLVTGRSPHLKRDIQSALPHREADEAVLAPPGAAQIEQLTTSFHGHMPGIEDRRRLRDYLTRGGRTTGALLERLKEALLRGDLERARGAWRFDWLPTKVHRDEAHEDYYQLLLHGLVGNARELVHWLACHRGALLLEELSAVSGMNRQALLDALERVRAYRVVDWIKDRRGERLRIVSDAVRESFYREIPERERCQYHQALVNYFSGLPGQNSSLYESLIYHYERLGRSREALEMRMRALAGMRTHQDLFSIRRHCREGVSFARELDGQGLDSHRWHVERYFIKYWIEAEWHVTNYQGLVELVRTHILGHGREVPLSFCYKYATALEKIGELTLCKELIAECKARIAEKNSKTFMQLLMVEASVLHATGAYQASIEVLDQVNADEDFIDASGFARICTIFMLNYQNLGNKSKYNQYMRMAESIAQRAGQYDHMLAISASKVLTYFNASQYGKAKRVLRNAIRIALRHRIYREASYLYFLASAVYYEEGRYKQGLKYLDKAIRVALNMGMREKVNDYMLRYALIYQNLGYYGNAIRHAETVKNQVSAEYRSEQYFFAVLILFDLHNCVKSERATTYKNELDELVGSVQAKYRLALYHRFSGDYFYDWMEYDEAAESFERARRMYESIDYDDDAARCVFRIAHVLTERGDFEKAWALLDGERDKIKQMESEDLNAEYFLACLTLHDAWQERPDQTEWYLVACEEALPRVSDVNIQMAMNAVLFRANLTMGRDDRAIAHFHLYYNQVKEIANNLPGADYASGFMSAREVVQCLEAFRSLNRKNKSRPAKQAGSESPVSVQSEDAD